ncbi:MbcA/ParS/Xre antitoxin family protein [Pseudomonas fluorescens]|uniref:antitoxin Xre/MbcA/ParS toxin-binding domain-containing protein n=1 Tax=Pseudomonas fluorescens TaxID=294 RepID=UPI00124092D9
MKSVTSSAEKVVLGKAFIRAGEGLGLDDTELSAVLDEHVSTVLLLRHGHGLLQPSTEAWSRALLLVELYQSLLAIVGNEQDARSWLSSENRGLCGRPRDLITCRVGLEQVVQYLAATRNPRLKLG